MIHVFRPNFRVHPGIAIIPLTKWCGAGNIANNYDDLWPAKLTDSCCREHDHCEDSISSGQSKYGLKNTQYYTSSWCKCDEKFYNCLEKAESLITNLVGQVYFNILCARCFAEDYPIIGCDDEKAGFIPYFIFIAFTA